LQVAPLIGGRGAHTKDRPGPRPFSVGRQKKAGSEGSNSLADHAGRTTLDLLLDQFKGDRSL
jgi:hypothetical protein